MTRTTEQWEELLDGVRPGPWKAMTDMEVITSPNGYVCMDYSNPNDGYLMAAAPDAVAEVIRMRKALEELRDDCAKAASTNDYDDYGQGTAHEAHRVAVHLTRILNGDPE